MTFSIEVSRIDAPKIRNWIKHHRGVAVWKSADLSDPSAKWFTPYADPVSGIPFKKPSWQCSDEPVVLTELSDVGVCGEVEFAVVPVTLRRGANGLKIKLTDASQRKVDKVMDKCAAKFGSAYYRTGNLEQPTVTVLYRTLATPLDQWEG